MFKMPYIFKSVKILEFGFNSSRRVVWVKIHSAFLTIRMAKTFRKIFL